MADKPAPAKPAAKPVVKKGKQNQVWKLYEAKGELKRKNQTCPKCGPGYFMAKHKDRVNCGKCGYTEMGKK